MGLCILQVGLSAQLFLNGDCKKAYLLLLIFPAMLLKHHPLVPGIRRIILTFCMLLFTTAMFAQSYTKADSINIYSLLNRADQESLTGTLNNALQYAQQALQLSTTKKMLRGQGLAILKIADICEQKDSTGSIPAQLKKAWDIGARLKDSFMLALSSYQQGQYNMYNNEYATAEQLFQKALALQFGSKTSSYTAQVYNDMGYLFGEQEDFEKEAMWYLRAVRVYEQVQDSSGLATTYSNLSHVYMRLGNTQQAFKYTKQAAALREQSGDVQGLCTAYENLSRLYWATSFDSATKYQQLAMQYAEKSGLQQLITRSYDNLSLLMDKQHKKKDAYSYVQKAIELSKNGDDGIALARRYTWAAILSADLKDTNAMKAYFNQAFLLCQQLNNKEVWRDFYGSKNSTYIKLGDYKNAHESLTKYYTYRDSLGREETTVRIAELQTKYDTEKKDNEISRLNTTQQIKQLEIARQTAIIAGNKIEAQQRGNEIKLLTQQQQLRDVRIQRQKEELEKQSLLAKNIQQEKELKERELKNQQQLRNFMIAGIVLFALLGWVLFSRYQLNKKMQQQKALLNIRNHIARDLHDEVGSTLTSIKILSEVSQSNLVKNREKAGTLLAKITEQSTRIQQGLSDIVWAIKTENDTLQNMLIRMREYIGHTLEPSGIKAYFEAEEDVLNQTAGMEQRRDLLLIFKEGINNTVKYSGATRVDISLSSVHGKVVLKITDNGKGFDTAVVKRSNGLGNMLTRAQLHGGSFSIFSEAGKGTRLEAEIPAG